MIIVRFKMTCRPDRAEAVRELLAEVVGPSRRVEGVVHFDIGRDLADPTSFVATEVFEDRAALDRQEALPEVTSVMEFFEDALAAEPEATIYEIASARPYGD